jgi:hypothetical protein
MKRKKEKGCSIVTKAGIFPELPRMAYSLLNHHSINNDDHEYSLTNQLALISTLPQPERTHMPSSGFVSVSSYRQE